MAEWRAFGFTGTPNRNGRNRPDRRTTTHVTPIWFALDDKLIFLIMAISIKGKTLRRDPRPPRVWVDDQRPSFPMLEGNVRIVDDNPQRCGTGQPSSADATWALTKPKNTAPATASLPESSSTQTIRCARTTRKHPANWTS